MENQPGTNPKLLFSLAKSGLIDALLPELEAVPSAPTSPSLCLGTHSVATLEHILFLRKTSRNERRYEWTLGRKVNTEQALKSYLSTKQENFTAEQRAKIFHGKMLHDDV